MPVRQRYDRPAIEPGTPIADATAWAEVEHPDDRSWRVPGTQYVTPPRVPGSSRAGSSRDSMRNSAAPTVT